MKLLWVPVAVLLIALMVILVGLANLVMALFDICKYFADEGEQDIVKLWRWAVK